MKYSKWFNIVVLILSAIGIGDTTYLTIKRFTHDSVNCSLFEGCDLVTTSSYSAIFGIPVAVMGIIFYVSIFGLTLWHIRSKNKKAINILMGLSSVGLLMSMWFVYTQAFILNSYCSYCLVSAGLSTTIFILTLILVLKSKDNSIKIENNYETNY